MWVLEFPVISSEQFLIVRGTLTVDDKLLLHSAWQHETAVGPHLVGQLAANC